MNARRRLGPKWGGYDDLPHSSVIFLFPARALARGVARRRRKGDGCEEERGAHSTQRRLDGGGQLLHLVRARARVIRASYLVVHSTGSTVGGGQSPRYLRVIAPHKDEVERNHAHEENEHGAAHREASARNQFEAEP